MSWLFLPLLLVFVASAFVGARALARRRGERARAEGQILHSRPGQHGLYALIWTAVPALVVLIAANVFSGEIEHRLLTAGAPDSVSQLEPFRREAFFADARRVGAGQPAAQIWPAPLAGELPPEGRRAASIHLALNVGGMVAALLASLLGGQIGRAHV